MADDKAAMIAFLHGHRAAERRQRVLLAAEGPQPALAVAESLAALDAAQQLGMWPAPRSEREERDIERLRVRWARIEQRAANARTR